MLNVDDKEFLDYLKAENEHAKNWFDSNADLTTTIVEEIRSRVQETDQSPAVRSGTWWYVSRTVEGLSYPIHCRATSRELAETTDADLILDQNIEADRHDFFDLGAFEPDPTHRYIAWSSDTEGNEHYTLRIRDASTGLDLGDTIPDTTWGGVAWSADSKHLFYVVADDTERPFQVRRHKIGTPLTDDEIVFTDNDERFFVGIELTRSGRFIIIHSGSKTSSEIHLLDASTPLTEPQCVRPRTDNVEYSVDDWGHTLVITTNLDAEDFCIMTAPHDDPSKWTEFVSHQLGHRITAAEPFEHTLAVHEWVNAQPRIRLVNTDGESRLIELTQSPHDIEFGPNENFSADERKDWWYHWKSPGLIEANPLGMVPTLLDKASGRAVNESLVCIQFVDELAAARSGSAATCTTTSSGGTWGAACQCCSAPAVLSGPIPGSACRFRASPRRLTLPKCRRRDP